MRSSTVESPEWAVSVRAGLQYMCFKLMRTRSALLICVYVTSLYCTSRTGKWLDAVILVPCRSANQPGFATTLYVGSVCCGSVRVHCNNLTLSTDAAVGADPYKPLLEAEDLFLAAWIFSLLESKSSAKSCCTVGPFICHGLTPLSA